MNVEEIIFFFFFPEDEHDKDFKVSQKIELIWW